MAVLASPVSANTKLRVTSMMLPVGAIIVKRSSVSVARCQKDALDSRGGLQSTLAGVATLLLVSETSVFGVKEFAPVQLTEHVTEPPCDAGGAQIRILFSLVDTLIGYAAVFVTPPIAPQTPASITGVMLVAESAVERKRNTCVTTMLVRN
jgi:hypothetical protein